MIRRSAFALVAVLAFTASPAAAMIPADNSSASSGPVVYQGEVDFVDGSKLLSDASGGIETVVPATDGSPGLAAAAASSGDVAFGSASPAGGTSPSQGLTNGETKAVAGQPQPKVKRLPSGTGVTPYTATPDGFILQGTNATVGGYNYTSDILNTKLNACQNGGVGPCSTIGSVYNQMKETLFGGSSIRWKLTETASLMYGPDPDQVDFRYWCGVNIPNSSDVTCATGDSSADASGVGPYIVSQYLGGTSSSYINKSFGSLYPARAKFPMMQIDTEWGAPYYTTVVEKVRGWDIRQNSKNVWVMSSVSGTGY